MILAAQTTNSCRKVHRGLCENAMDCVELPIPPHKRKRRLQRSNSTSSIFVKHTVDAPNPEYILNGVAHLLTCLIWLGDQERLRVNHKRSRDSLIVQNTTKNEFGAIFDERRYLKISNFHTKSKGPVRREEILTYLRKLLKVTKLSAECVVVGIVLLRRFVGVMGIQLNAHTWRLLTLEGILLAQKTINDNCLANSEIPKVWDCVVDGADLTLFNLQLVNKLERTFVCKALHFNVFVSGLAFAKFFFELEELSPSRSKSQLSTKQGVDHLHYNLKRSDIPRTTNRRVRSHSLDFASTGRASIMLL